MSDGWLPIAVLGTSLLASPLIFLTPERHVAFRTFVNLAAAVLKLVLVGYLGWQVAFEDARYVARLPMLPGFDFVLQVDPLALLFLALSASLWLLTTIYAVGNPKAAPIAAGSSASSASALRRRPASRWPATSSPS